MRWGIVLLSITALAACENTAAVERTERQIQDVDRPRVQALVETSRSIRRAS
ncbi:MAG: hypothetical protein JRG70_10605 [Deltaproteobacteria bacterium]|nr:hypothetical protein [Deltaproteobacteria bacterium]